MASINDDINKSVSNKINICVKFVETGSTIVNTFTLIIYIIE